MERAARFFRVSSDTQDEANQINEVNQHIAQHQYNVARTFRLHDVSAAKGEHEAELAEILADIKAGLYTVVVVSDSSRIDRRDVDIQELYAISVRQAGGRIESASEPEFGKTTVSGRVTTLLAQQANYDYSRKIAEHTRRGFNRIDANGAIRNKAKYGYQITGEKYHHKFEIIESEAEVIRDSAKWYMAGQSLATICRRLNESGRLTHNGNQWSVKTLAQVLRSETIMGRRHQGTVIVKVPAILTVREWNQLQAKLNQRAYRKGTRTYANKPQAMLTGMLDCPRCDRPMYRTGGRYYYCRPHDGVSCKMMIPIADMDAKAIQWVADLIASGAKVTREVVIPGHNYQDDIDRIALEIRDLDPLAEDWLERVTAYQAEIAHLRTLPSEPDHTETVEIDLAEITGKWDQISNQQRRAIMLECGMKFTVEQD